MHRLFELILALTILIVLLPVFLITTLLIFLTDFDQPFYVANRVGRDGVSFKMYKFRSMQKVKSMEHIVSTSETDTRITWVGKIIRKFKIDEFSQVINVILGNMQFVGPRPNVESEISLFTILESEILSVKPGITDISSIVFSDLNTILKDSKNVNLDYNQLVRPWKSRLALLYIKNRSLKLDLELMFLTVYNSLNRGATLRRLKKIVLHFSNDPLLSKIAGRELKLFPYPPPGSNSIVIKR
jgi:lipopolysaccharide/colanic/teichoic acid biosynthesis glycosyltransferase